MEAINKVAATISIQFTLREWLQLKELASILQPFYEATQLTEGQKVGACNSVVRWFENSWWPSSIASLPSRSNDRS